MSTALGKARKGTSALYWLVLLAMAWSQLAFALHHAHHEPADLGEACAVCLQFDRDDDVILEAGEPRATSTPGTPAPDVAKYAGPAENLAFYRARASP